MQDESFGRRQRIDGHFDLVADPLRVGGKREGVGAADEGDPAAEKLAGPLEADAVLDRIDEEQHIDSKIGEPRAENLHAGGHHVAELLAVTVRRLHQPRQVRVDELLEQRGRPEVGRGVPAPLDNHTDARLRRRHLGPRAVGLGDDLHQSSKCLRMVQGHHDRPFGPT